MRSAASGLDTEEGAAVREMLKGWGLWPAMDAYLPPASSERGAVALGLGQARERIRTVLTETASYLGNVYSSEPDAKRLLEVGLTEQELREVLAELAAPLPDGEADGVARASMLQARELSVKAGAVLASGLGAPVLMLQGQRMGRGIEVEVLLFTGGSGMPSGGGASSSSSSSNSMRGGGGSAAGASSTVCLESCITVGSWAGHYYAGVLQEEAVCVLLPDDEQLATRATASAADSACKALGMAFRMGMVPAHLRRCLVEVSSATYLKHGTMVTLQPEPCAGEHGWGLCAAAVRAQ
ncbi:hypothetical protein HXX76_008594 [Chlamydomonas incerta]|uniref:Uncharacterized protein n=1 Tax=Chlamydomonas incerta TaxID=51695 RepID=A0A835ST41_CHLIN|nr:hypothetical protein HXX76_008594 [Chlamydomonas incerta]|eukprot:KAG2432862.1 hypothetical protein HXX76_008594 [Chlamydomonas incerta]